MKLISSKSILQNALANKYAVGAFNLNNLEWTKTILKAAQDLNSPVILEVAARQVEYMGGYTTVVSLVNSLINEMNITVPVALHLDHGSYEDVLKAINNGFTSVMFDGSKLDFETNLQKTQYLTELCHSKNITIEAEVGAIGDEDGVNLSVGECADPLQCLSLAKTGIDSLAAGIGNIHGVYPENWGGLQFNVLQEIKNTIGNDLPLVLHGGSGIPNDQIKKAISMGISKINVNTELSLAFSSATEQYFDNNSHKIGKGYDIRAIMNNGMEAVYKTVCDKIKLFGSDNKGSK